MQEQCKNLVFVILSFSRLFDDIRAKGLFLKELIMSFENNLKVSRIKINQSASFASENALVRVSFDHENDLFRAELDGQVLGIVSFGPTEGIAIHHLRNQLFSELVNDPTLIPSIPLISKLFQKKDLVIANDKALPDKAS